jgi:hypothetical protein
VLSPVLSLPSKKLRAQIERFCAAVNVSLQYFDLSIPDVETTLSDDDFKRAHLVQQDSHDMNGEVWDAESMYAGDKFEGDIANPHLNASTIEAFITGAGVDNGLLANAIRNRYQLWQVCYNVKCHILII